MEERSKGLQSLPVELIRQIHLWSLSPALPLVSKALHFSLSSPGPNFAARYLFELYDSTVDNTVQHFLARALRHGICTFETVLEVERIWDRRRRIPSKRDLLENQVTRPQRRDEDDELRSPPEPSVPGLQLKELPRRLFRPRANLTPRTYLSPLVRHLFDHYTPSANSHEGYALSRAVILRDVPLINFLLDHGADPNQRQAIAVQLAVDKMDLDLVKLLVERKEEGGKRRRLEDRVQITETLVARAMRNDRTPEGRAIINYFVNEKGSVPSLNAIMKMGKQPTRRPVKRSRVQT